MELELAHRRLNSRLAIRRPCFPFEFSVLCRRSDRATGGRFLDEPGGKWAGLQAAGALVTVKPTGKFQAIVRDR
jgi:hypothetical protein